MANITNTGKITYSIVGRYMNGSAVSAYHIIGSDGKELKASRELVCFLVGKGVVTNCKGQMNGGDVALRGVGVNLTEIPVKNERTGKITRTDNLGNVKPKNPNDSRIFTQLMICARLFQDGRCLGYVVRDAGGTEKKLERSVVLKLAADKKIGNARINMANGTPILRGVGVELDKLPIIQLPSAKKVVNNTEKVNIVGNVKNLKIGWYAVEAIMTKLESKFIKDSSNNASGVYQYPVLELMNAHSATMTVKTDKGIYKVTQVRKGISTEHPDYGLEFVLSNAGEKIRVICEDISMLAFNIHVLGFIAITALLKMDRETTVREFTFENKLERLIWREYTTIKNTNTFKIDTDKTIEVGLMDTAKLQSDYDIGLSPLSSLGDRRRHPTMSMVANHTAIMGINTSTGYYEIGRIKYMSNSRVGIALELINKSSGNTHIITASNIDKSKVTTKNISIICCAALLKLDPQITINDVVVENESEHSVVGYNFTKK